MQVPNLTTFRYASNAKKIHLTPAGGDVFKWSAATPSDMAVLEGESFGYKERRFLRELLKSDILAFSLTETYQIHVRTLWHADSISTLSAATGMRRKGKFAVLLHDLKGDLTSSWAWAKFIRPLHRQGFSVIAVDLPGFGKSAISQNASCSVSSWQGQQAHVISKIMEELAIASFHLLAFGHAAGMFFNALLNAPQRMLGSHVLINPVFDRNQLFAFVGIEPPPGGMVGWDEHVREKQIKALVNLLRTTSVKLWCMFDRDEKYRFFGQEHPSKAIQEEWVHTADTHQFLIEATRNEFVAQNLTLTEITKNDLCETQIGKKIPVRMLIPSRHLKSSIARHVANFENRPWAKMYKPNHGLPVFRGNMLSQVGTLEGLEEDRFDDSEEEHPKQDWSARSSQKATSTGLSTQRALALIPGQGAKSSALSTNLETDLQLRRRLQDEQASEAVALRSQTMEDKKIQAAQFAARASRLKARSEGNKMTMSRSDGALTALGGTRPPSGGLHDLTAAADIAKARLRQSGADTDRRTLAAQSTGKAAINWSRCPFEADLSYGVRKMYLDALEASVDTFEHEQDQRYQESRKGGRRAYRGDD
jgi:pimeloyl-ACP methyl ester carboxylesterase